MKRRNDDVIKKFISDYLFEYLIVNIVYYSAKPRDVPTQWGTVCGL